jgi:RNA polymerase sigma-70 factor (ECF subfamily)
LYDGVDPPRNVGPIDLTFSSDLRHLGETTRLRPAANPSTKFRVARDGRPANPLHNTMNENTITLWQKARGGDQEAYDRLFAIYSDRTLMFIRARLGPRLRAVIESRDILQDTYLAAHRDFSSFDYTDDGAFGRWLCRIIENRIRDLGDYWGAKKRQVVALPEPEPETGPVTAVERDERRQALLRGIDALGEDHRMVLLLRYFEGLDAEEAGHRMNRSDGAIRKLTARALAELGGLL